jgi:Protein of unknown function (DUF3750)
MKRPSAKWLLLLPAAVAAMAHVDREQNRAPGDWRSASQASVGLAPDPATTPEPIIQVYAARTVRWRGYFGVHTWLAAKPSFADRYTVYEVIGWRLRRAGSAVVVSHRPADARWFGNAPTLVAEVRGDGVDDMIERLEQAVADYPYATTYRVWPGPNSNTFTAHVLRAVPALKADLPATAIGKDFLAPTFVAVTPSGTGVQANAYGIFGVMLGWEEGIELNLLGLTFGVDPLDLALKLPLAGTLSARRFFTNDKRPQAALQGD